MADNLTWDTSPALLIAAKRLRELVTAALLRSPDAAISIPNISHGYDPDLIRSDNPNHTQLSYYCTVGLDATLSDPRLKLPCRIPKPPKPDVKELKLVVVADTSVNDYTSKKPKRQQQPQRQIDNTAQIRTYEEQDERGYTHVICEDTLEPLFDAVYATAFFEHISQVSDPFVHILSKLLMVKCRRRKSTDVWNRKFQVPGSLARKYNLAEKESERKMYALMIAKRTGIRSKMCSMVLCSLLGNYQHVRASSRPVTRESRKTLYDLFCFNQHFDFIDALMTQCDNLINFAMREYLVYAIENMPAFKEEIVKLFNWEDFKTKVITAMDTYREWLSDQLDDPSASIWQSIQYTDTRTEFFDYTCTHFKNVHETLVHYYASMFTVESILKKKRKRIKLVRLPTAITQPIELSEDELERQFNESLNDVKVGSLDPDDEDEDTFDLTTTKYSQAQLDAIHARELDKQRAALRVSRYIAFELYMPQEHIQVMRDMVRGHINRFFSDPDRIYTPTSTLLFMIRFIRIFGITREAAVRTAKLITLLQRGAWSNSMKGKQLRQFKKSEPYAYTLVQCCIDMVTKALEIVVVAELPQHYTDNQIAAIQNRSPWVKTLGAVFLHPTLFYFCQYCKNTPTQVREFDISRDQLAQPNDHTRKTVGAATGGKKYNPKKKKSQVILSSYLHMDGCLYDRTNTKWCQSSRSTRFKECDEVPLCCPSLLGRIIRFDGDLLCLCPQCGFAMVYTASRCAVLDTGMVCARCTQLEENKRYVTKYNLMVRLGYPPEQEVAQCMACPKKMNKTSCIYLYPCSILLCGRCSSNALAIALDTANIVINKENVTRFILDFLELKAARRANRSCGRLRTYGNMTRDKWSSQRISNAFD